MFSLHEIFNWVGSNPAQKFFINAEKIIEAGHLIKCGKTNESINSDVVSFSALCLQSSHVKDRPHEINGSVSKNGKIISVKCSCKAGLGEKCKHVVATLLYCYRKGEQLSFFSCTDKKCQWKNQQDRILKEYNAVPINQHACFSMSKRKNKIIEGSAEGPITDNNSSTQPNIDEDLDVVNEGEVFEQLTSTSAIKRKPPAWSTITDITEDQKVRIIEKVVDRLKDSAFVKHRVGRHEPIVIKR